MHQMNIIAFAQILSRYDQKQLSTSRLCQHIKTRVMSDVATAMKTFSLVGWRRGSVVRASVSDWRTFPDMRLIYG